MLRDALLSSAECLRVAGDTYDQGKGLTQLVGTVRGTGGVGTGQLVQHPRGGSVQALKVVLGAANHCEMGERCDASVMNGEWVGGDCRTESIVKVW